MATPALRALLALALLLSGGTGAAPPDSLQQEFNSPPDSAKPRVWWHWMDGNITREGIEADLSWFKRIGIGGVHQTDIGLNTPQLTPERLVYMKPGWQDAFAYAARRAGELDIELGIFTSPGWSATGGPWVRPEQAMKKMVWSATPVTGGQLFHGRLAPLPTATGPFQDISSQPDAGSLVNWAADRAVPTYGADTIVIAYRQSAFDATTPAPVPRVTSSAGAIAASVITDDDRTTALPVAQQANGRAPWIQFEYAQPYTARSVTVAVNTSGAVVNLSASDDGRQFRRVTTLYPGTLPQTTESFAPVTARFFRFTFPRPKAGGPGSWDAVAAPGADRTATELVFAAEPANAPPLVINDLVLRHSGTVHRPEQKAGFGIVPDYYAIPTPEVPPDMAIPASDVIDLSGHLEADGTLRWQAPAGEWTVLRMGYSLLNSMNHAAPREATGFEVDKLNRRHVQDYLDTYFALYADALGQPAAAGLGALMSDSLEFGVQNWTEDILAQFKRLRGYDPVPWLPALVGVVVESAGKSDQFLWDFRRTLADLMLESHYQVLSENARRRGLVLYGEALENYRFSFGDDMDLRRFTDIPTAAMWMFPPGGSPKPGSVADIRGAASVAHIYGQNLVAAESLTSALAPWAYAPRDLKHVMDLEFALGVNRPIIHSTAHQPLTEKAPGLSLAFFGQHFNRLETWSEQAKPWIDYMARTAYMLQQGRYVADIAYFYGEEAPLNTLFSTGAPAEIPPGYSFDFVSADALLTRLTVEDGELVTASGMRYAALHLGGSSQRMTLPVLRKVRDLVLAGAAVTGQKPVGSPSLADDPDEFRRIADSLWEQPLTAAGQSHTPSDPGGRVISERSVGEVLNDKGLLPDFVYSSESGRPGPMFLHRKMATADIYFVSNPGGESITGEAAFRVSGKKAEIWHADTGVVEPTSYRSEGGRTHVPLDLGPFQSVLVVFRQPGEESVKLPPAPPRSFLHTLDGGWTLAFDEASGKSRTLSLASLTPWNEHEDPAVRFYSGSGVYSRTLNAPADWFKPGARLVLDLGDVRELAQVAVNGQWLQSLWKPPYRCDITAALRPGENTLQVRVTNLWVNRLVGDQQPGVTPATTTSAPTYLPTAPLKPSGLLGPVTIAGWPAPAGQAIRSPTP